MSIFDKFIWICKHKNLQIIFTDQDAATARMLIEHVFQEVQHGLCTFHIMQNAAKQLLGTYKSDVND